MTDCIFCKIAKGDIPAKVVYKDNEVVAFEDINPQAPVHIVLIPHKHIERISDITGADDALMGKMLRVGTEIAKEKNIASNGFRLVANCNKDAGQEVFHIHIHLLGGRKFNWPPG